MYQLITTLLQPYAFLLLSLLAALVWAWRTYQPRRRSLGVALGLAVLLCLLSTMAAGHVAVGSLEWSYPPSSAVPSPSDTIVVLAGNVYVDNKEGTKVRIGGTTLFRCLHAYQLYDRAGGCRLIVSGGKVDPSQPGMSVAEAMRDFFVLLGVRPGDIVLEDKSTNTFENARNTCELLRGEPAPRVFLVTTASHMRRAERCFAKQGTAVIPAPCNHQAVRLEIQPTNFIPSAEGIRGVQAALHEWMGLVWYWLRGRI